MIDSARPYQAEGLAKSKAAMERGVYQQLIAWATGTGKTFLFANLAKHHGLTGRGIYLVGREELATQAADKLRRWNPGESVGIEMSDQRSKPSDRFVVASVPTIGREGSPRLTQFDPSEFSLVVIDESHHATAQSYQTVLKHFGVLEPEQTDRLLVGVTATPRRSDGVGLAHIFREIVHRYDIRDAIRDGWLSDLLGEQLHTDTQLDGVHAQAGDFVPGELSAVVNIRARNRAIARYWMDRAAYRPTIGYGVDIEHCKALAEVFRGEGIKAEAIWGNDRDRSEKLEKHRAGEIQVLFNAQLLIEGYDDWRIQCILNAKPTKSSVNYTQMIGRGTRLEEGLGNLKEALAAGKPIKKSNCLVLDVTDATTRHSLVSINSLFGLPPKMSLKGKSVMEAVEEVEKVALTKPLVDFSQCESLDNIQAWAERVDLLAVRYCQEVLEHSEFQWHQRWDGAYVITLPNKGLVEIMSNILGWAVSGTVEGASFGPEAFKDLSEAFYFADAMLRQFGRGLLNMLRRESKAKWAKDKITDRQIAALKIRLRQLKLPEPDWGSMSKIDGVALHRKLYANTTRKVA